MPSAPEPLPAGKPSPADAMSGAQQFAQRTANASARAVVYPESDGEPMAETDIHHRTIVDASSILRTRYADREDVYVAGDMNVYYVEGNTDIKFSPDVFVAFGPSREPPRRVWKTWEEGKFADFVLEVASKGTHGDDEARKRRLYERLGATEYWQHDPTGDYIDPLKGHRLNAQGTYERLPLTTTPDGMPGGESKVLGLYLCLDEGRLRLFDPTTGKFLFNHQEEHRGRLEERRGRLEERQARLAAEAEVERLKRQLAHR